jgi:hypothetical protein
MGSHYIFLKNVPKKCIQNKLTLSSIIKPSSFYYTDLDLRNTSWKPECVLSFNIGWQILVFYPDPFEIQYESSNRGTLIRFTWNIH